MHIIYYIYIITIEILRIQNIETNLNFRNSISYTKIFYLLHILKKREREREKDLYFLSVYYFVLPDILDY